MPINAKSSTHWNGQIYSKISSPQYMINSEFLSTYSFVGNEIVLDIGCGNGKTTQEIAMKLPNGRIMGVDASESMIDSAYKENISSNCNFKIMDAQKIEFHGEFDLCTSFFCMQWIPDKFSTFKKIEKGLKVDGEFLMIVPMPHPFLPIIRKKLAAAVRWKKYFNDYQDPLIYINDDNYKNYVEDAGLLLTNYEIKKTPVLFKDYDSFFEFMSQMTPHLSQISCKSRKDEFMHELIGKYSEYHPPKADGSFELVFILLFLRAIKQNQKI